MNRPLRLRPFWLIPLALAACSAPVTRPKAPTHDVPASRVSDIVIESPAPAQHEVRRPTLPQALVDQLARGHYAMAEKVALAQLAVRPDDPWLLANLGLARLHLGRPDQAVEALEAARKDPVLGHDPRLLNELGMAYRRLGRFDAAERAYRQAVAESPAYAPAWRNLGILVELYRQRPGEALTYYRRYLELHGPDEETVRRWIVDIEHRLAKDKRSGGPS